ncbi:MAG: serine--tRNA ligase, partial [Candidatus Methanomethylophilaceae archaeon]|nr:serine--tRNA ligase [Candidatus Methanomethylophilaceae archaeon]
MLDVSIIRSNPEMIRTMLQNRNKDDDILNNFLAADEEWRQLTNENNGLRKIRNDVSMQISKMSQGTDKDTKIVEMRDVGDKIKANDARMAELDEIRNNCVLNIPNIPDKSVPLGKDSNDNVIVYEWGEKRKFDFKPKEHWEIADDLGIIDFDGGVKVAGSGFYCLRGDGARLERALINYFLDMHHKQGYTEIFPPVIVNKNALIGTGQYPNLKDDMYHLEKDDMYLNPTAEVPLTNLFQDDILDKEQLPIKYTAYLPSFRREVGKHADTRGIIRVHEFNKVEMVRFVLPETSWPALEELRNDAEELIKGLNLPYHVLLLCTGDMSFSCAKCFDLELYAPGKDAWLEASSCSNFTDFQARRARIKYRPEPHLKSEFIHTLNG